MVLSLLRRRRAANVLTLICWRFLRQGHDWQRVIVSGIAPAKEFVEHESFPVEVQWYEWSWYSSCVTVLPPWSLWFRFVAVKSSHWIWPARNSKRNSSRAQWLDDATTFDAAMRGMREELGVHITKETEGLVRGLVLWVLLRPEMTVIIRCYLCQPSILWCATPGTVKLHGHVHKIQGCIIWVFPFIVCARF